MTKYEQKLIDKIGARDQLENIIYNEVIIRCPYCGHEHERQESCLGRGGETVFHRCRNCHGDWSNSIDFDVAAEDEYWEN